MATSMKTVEKMQIIEAKNSEDLAKKYNALIEELQDCRNDERLLSSIPLKIVDRQLVINDSKYVFVVVYEDFLPVKSHVKGPKPTSDGMSAIPQDVRGMKEKKK
jgi:hypothetical protein